MAPVVTGEMDVRMAVLYCAVADKPKATKRLLVLSGLLLGLSALCIIFAKLRG